MKGNAIAASLAAVAIVSGCGKHTGTEATPPAPVQASDATPAPVDGAAPAVPVAAPVNAEPTVIPEGENTSATLARLTKELHRQIARTHQLPSSFEDFVAKARLQVPPAPAGKKYAFSSDWKVVLVNR